ncbi:MAG TPA: glycine zipper 2TM domain-containing protein [Rhodocyclaceae bacterium]|nr:glycine zipper 2TM domain-containing protein [Rhodocyclaceae bacterium]
MNRLNIIFAVSLLGVAAAAHAGGPGRGHHGDSYRDWARVTHVQPHYERVRVPYQQCTSDVVYDYDGPRGGDRSYGGAVIGGIAGGVLGNQVGKGSGKTAATAVGAVVGAMVGDRIDNDGYRTAHRAPHGRTVERCHTVERWEDRPSGYNVTYEYNGRQYTRFMSEHPGRRIRVNVSVTPA